MERTLADMVNHATDFDALEQSDMEGVTGKKWTSYPGMIGAWIAEMDFATAPAIIDAVTKASQDGFYGYLPDQLEKDLASAVANWYKRHTDWAVSPDQIHSMPDVLTGMTIALQHYAPKGGKVVLPTPAYMPFLMIPGLYDRELIEVPMNRTSDSWEFDYDGIEKAFQDGGEILIICNPYNPTGRVLTWEECVRLGEIVDRYDGRVFSDEIHAPLVFGDAQLVPYASVNEVNTGHTITAIAASKAWNLAGLKCAALVLSNDADIEAFKGKPMWAAHGASTLGVIASIAAFNDGESWLADVVSYLDGNRQRLGELVAEHLPGAVYSVPEGTYLAWIDLTGTAVPEDVGAFFRDNAQVVITDGSACGDVGKRCVRFNFATSRRIMEEAITRMGNALADA